MKTRSHRKEKIQLITLGCSKNWVDSENIITQLKYNNFDVRHNPDGKPSEIVIINTCGFIDLAKEESINTILEYASLKEEGRIDKLYVTGCLSQRYKDQLKLEIPQVDAFFGTFDMPDLIRKLNADYKRDLLGERCITTPKHYAYLKISEGCNRTCSFCAIPLMRGKHVSVPIDQLVSQAVFLARQGVKELILIAQELTYYGLDLYKKRALPSLLEALSDVEGIKWIRLHYAYPSKFPVEVLDVMAQRANICKYLDVPLQHISDSVLARMKRQINREETENLIAVIRDKIPEIHLRTTMMVGFPGETAAEFDELCDFIEKQKFERLGVFKYSHEEDTDAHELEDNIAPEEKERRASYLMAIQEEISLAHNQKKVGQTFDLVIDRKEGQHYFGRTEYDSPEVDNEVIIDAEKTKLAIGAFEKCRVIEALPFDLIAEKIS